MIRQPSAACYLTRHSLWTHLASKSSRHCAHHSKGHAMTPKLAPYEGFDPHTYTGGRWLRHDKLERDSRYIKFNFSALCQRVLELCPGAESITSYQKTEGGFNRVFIFTLSNAKRVVARLPFTLAGPSKLATTSEVATIKYLQAKTSIPIPPILDWSNDSTNSIGSEYIIMEHAAGVQLHNKWPDMAADQQVRCIDAIYRKAKEMIDIEFPAFGSLFFVDSPLDSGHKTPLDEMFCIGPHCGSRYWDCNVSEPKYYHNTKPNNGPWIPPVDIELEKRPSFHGSTELHVNLLKHARTVLKRMSADSQVQSAATPALFHPDLHKRNIFVSEDDPSIVTGIIDWQSASIEPAFWYADGVPDFAEPGSLCAKTFAVCSQFLTPKLFGPRLMDENLFRPFRYSYRTWKDGAVALTYELIETSRSWKELGLAGSSPYPLPTQKELADHEREYKLFVAAQNLKRDLSSLLNTASDGWVPLEDWEETKSAHREVFDGMLNAVLTNDDSDYDEPVKDEKVLRSIWPFDLNT
ncbi:hypothetical protein I7I50_04696 [Histoplasma capsulatum G186AR]|uniref:Altered inheritance of mitochondria protein 9, mitochondrial n=1 Tax=Ajellomyces capsulatus TaxID=5037 RepID=A0A8H8CZ67_AJECA|nr:hypothetical protein I7I52_05605 [Histoplasma capsulatum]QSS75531.1 hypothetical protein I7I50_04696 [Histoplasma capsulatum G186AR]